MKIYIKGDITLQNFYYFSKKLDEIEAEESDAHVEVRLFSEGGEGIAALAYFDRIKNSSCKIKITCYGPVYSAAMLILAGGDVRRMAKNAWVMVHEDSESFDGTRNVMELERDAKHYRRLENQWCKILSEVTKTSLDKWIELHKNETYLSAEECLELGLIDEII